MANKIDNLFRPSSQFTLTLLGILLVMATSSYLGVAQDRLSPSRDRELLDAKSRSLVRSFANPSLGDSKRAVETVKVRGKQALVLRVAISPGVDYFRIKLDGTAEFTPGASAQPDQPPATRPPTPTQEASRAPDSQSLAGAAKRASLRHLNHSSSLTTRGRAQKPTINPNLSTFAGTVNESGMPTPEIAVMTEGVIAPKRRGVVILVRNWSAFRIGRFDYDRIHPQVVPPSPCDQTRHYRYVLDIYMTDGVHNVCRNLASAKSLREIRTNVPADSPAKGFYIVITDLQTKQSVKSNVAQ
jgi:hypothetical protein